MADVQFAVRVSQEPGAYQMHTIGRMSARGRCGGRVLRTRIGVCISYDDRYVSGVGGPALRWWCVVSVCSFVHGVSCGLRPWPYGFIGVLY
eukprot:2700926-Prymnesium_polylepis.1